MKYQYDNIKRNVNSLTAIVLAFGMFGLSACETTGGNGGGGSVAQQPHSYKVAQTNPYTPAGLQGKNLVRVALLIPMTSNSSVVRGEAENIKAAADLALKQSGDGQTVMFSVDSGTTAEEAAAATKNAISQGADFILGPLFATGVASSAPYIRANNTTMFAFSTDPTQAGDGVYIFSFMAEDEANRIISYAAKRGIKNLEILAPTGAYGDRIIDATNKAARKMGLNIIGSQKYDQKADATVINAAAKRAAIEARTVGNNKTTAIFIAERGPLLKQIAKTLASNGASPSRVQYLGTGLWKDTLTVTDSNMFGAWFVTADTPERATFANVLQNKYPGKSATRLAGMSYDAMTLIAKNAVAGDKSRISTRLLERNRGFNGVDGQFRFNDGVIEREMPIMEITGNGIRIIDEAPKEF